MVPNLDYVCARDRKKLEKYLSVDLFSKVHLEKTVYRNAIVLPVVEKYKPFRRLGGVLDCDGVFLPSSGWSSVCGDGYYPYDNLSLDYIDKAIYIGNLTYTWGHMLTDSLKKLWFLYTEEANKLINNGYKVIFVGFKNSPAPEYARELFNLAGVDFNSLVHITNITRCRNLVLPDDSIFRTAKGALVYTDEYLKVINMIKNSVPAMKLQGEKKLYFARVGCNNNKKDYGEKSLIDVFQSNGFKIISPEDFSVKDQIGMLKGCKYFAATEGSISHNAIFCEPATKCIILRKCSAVYSYSALVNQASKVDVTLVDAHHSNHLEFYGRYWCGPFYLCVTKYLEKFFNQKILHRHRWFNRDWYRYIMNNPFAPERDFLIKVYKFFRRKTLRLLFSLNA